MRGRVHGPPDPCTMAPMTQRPRSNAPKTGRHKKKAPWWRPAAMRAASVAVTLLVWLLRATCRIRVVEGAAHVDATLAGGAPFIPCGWHQRIIMSGLFLRSLVPRGLRLGFLISPSREGEFIARVAKAHRTETIRGSSSRSGKQAMRALVEAVRAGLSPMMYGDGPRGPAGVFKPGAIVLSSRTGAALLPVGCAADRYWQLRSWDRHRIPKPFARITVAVGAPWVIGPLEDESQARIAAQTLGERLDALTDIAESAQRR